MAQKRSPARPFIPDDDRPKEIPWEAQNLAIENAIEKIRPPRVRHACRNAINHLRKAWRLHPVDSEMSLFCAITAEEEAATALIRALNEQKYPNAKLLNEKKHPHKASIWQFMLAINNIMIDKNIPMPNVGVSTDGAPRIELSIDIAAQAGLSFPMWGTPDEPFNWSLSSDRTGPFITHDFSEELAAIAAERGARNIESHVATEANLRNQILYASNEGIPSVEFKDALILDRRARVMVILTVTIAVMQTKQHQQFLVQCVTALLKAIQRFDEDMPDFPEPDPSIPRIEMEEQAEGPMKASLVIRRSQDPLRYSMTAPTLMNGGDGKDE